MSGASTGLVWAWGSAPTTPYQCGWCGQNVSPITGGVGRSTSLRSSLIEQELRVLVCPVCKHPTFLDPLGGIQVPRAPLAREIDGLPTDVEGIYGEARNATSVGAYTAAALCCRKLLMHVAVSKGADPGKPFQPYVDFLLQKGFVPNQAKGWVDSIRLTGNEATHEIKFVTRDEAQNLLAFTEMLLQLVYDFPTRGNRS